MKKGHSSPGIAGYIKGFLSLYSFSYPRVLVYMLQSTEYQIAPYLSWWWRVDNFFDVAKRRTLDMTRRAGLLLYLVRLGMFMQILLGAILSVYGFGQDDIFIAALGASAIILYPVIWGQLITLPLLLAKIFIVAPKERVLIARSAEIFANHKGATIAVAGSYGKTTVKELLLTILGEGKNVAATPANKNVASSHAKFASKLTGNEDILIIEYGEGKPGDVPNFIKTTRPDIGIITGLAPAHLDQYKTLDAAAEDIFTLVEAVGEDNIYVNDESRAIQAYTERDYPAYSSKGALGWSVSAINVTAHDLSFTMKKGKNTIKIKSGLVGRHLIGPLALSAALAYEFGLTIEQIESGASKTKPYEHRMQPRSIAGAWVIDDTYNGNLEGVRAGLALLKEIKSKRKIYVTPGLVDQGKEAEHVHKEMGELIAEANPDKVVLMNNSVTDWIRHGMDLNGYRGEVVIEDDPLSFYINLDQTIATGDTVLMQNDWTDNYK